MIRIPENDELEKSVRLNRCIAIYRDGGMEMGDLIGRMVTNE